MSQFTLEQLQSEEYKNNLDAVHERLESLSENYNQIIYLKNRFTYPASNKYQEQLISDLESFVGTRKEHEEYEKERKVFYKKLLKEDERDYDEERGRLLGFLKSDLEISNNLSNHPKRDILYSKAWERGHSDGLYEVKNQYENLLDLLTLYIDAKWID